MVQSVLLAATSKSNSSGSIYFILILFAAVYFFYLRPRRAKMLAQRAGTQAPVEIAPGDTVVMTSGIIGRVLSIDGDRASVEIAPDTVIEIQRTALGRRIDPDAPDESERWASLTESSGPDAPTEIVHDDPETKADDDEHPGGTP